jgi:hypothetical protein
VVFGQITNQEGYQFVNVSLSSNIDQPENIPLAGCYVVIMDDKGNLFELQASDPGVYRVWLESEYVQPGTSYQLRIVTPDGSEIQSEFDKMPESAKIDSLYYNIESAPPLDPGTDLPGVQFYLDLDGEDSESRYFRWELEESWEHRTFYAIERYYTPGVHHYISPPDSSHMFCYHQIKNNNFFTLSTENLTQNKFAGVPLNYVGNNTTHLSVLYSLLVRQFSISRTAYEYWDDLRVNSSNSGGLYETQPLPVKGNLVNLTDPQNEVLGIFNAASSTEKRIFVKKPEELDVIYETSCYGPEILHRGGLDEHLNGDSVLYYILLVGNLRPLQIACVDCLALGGSLTKPEHWPDEN